MIIKEKSNFKPAPEGIHNAVCVDVVELPNVTTQWGVKDMIRLVWEIEETMDSGKPYLITQRYTPSLNERSNLRKHLKSWRGKDFSAEELAGFDIDKLIGVCCQMVIVHNESSDGNTYANIQAIIKAKEQIKPSGEYVRVKDRPENSGAPKSKKEQGKEMDNETVPY